jgi:hypothetical protein
MEDTKMTAKETAIAFKDWCDQNEFHLIRQNKSIPLISEELFEHFMQEQNNQNGH